MSPADLFCAAFNMILFLLYSVAQHSIREFFLR